MSEGFKAPQKILACVDGSETSYRVADFSIALSRALGSTVTFVFVVGASTSDPNYKITADMVGSFEVLGTEVLSKCRDKAQKGGVKFETRQLEGEPADEILRNAEETKSDCIVIGKKGLGRLEKLLLGSVSEKVLKFSKVPVIIVK